MSLRQEVLPSDAKIPQVVNKLVWAGVDRHGCACVGMQQAWRVIGRYRRYSSRGRETGSGNKKPPFGGGFDRGTFS